MRVLVLVMGLLVAAAGAQADVAARVADGAAWDMTGQNGRSGTLTLKGDGTGTMRAGPFSLATDWWGQGANGLCLKNRMMGTRCVTLRPGAGGYDGVADGATVLRLRR
ncbi:MAG: hypothetical protein AAF318_15365 [Pseudomonadota bacterium]